MPYRKTHIVRRRRADAIELTPGLVRIAFTGDTFIREKFHSREDEANFWRKQRAVLMRWWFAGVPSEFPAAFGFYHRSDDRMPHAGCRPHFWWKFDAPEKQRRVTGFTEWARECSHYNGKFRRSPTAEEIAGVCTPHGASWELICGVPTAPWLLEFESESDYLRRHGLLTEREIVLLPKFEIAWRQEEIIESLWCVRMLDTTPVIEERKQLVKELKSLGPVTRVGSSAASRYSEIAGMLDGARNVTCCDH